MVTKLEVLSNTIIILNRYKKYSRREIEDNIDIRGAVERYLYIATQALIDAVESFIALKKYQTPQSMADGFRILREEKVLDSQLAEYMINMVGFRNILAHGYQNVNYNLVYQILQQRLKDLTKVSNVLRKRL